MVPPVGKLNYFGLQGKLTGVNPPHLPEFIGIMVNVMPDHFFLSLQMGKKLGLIILQVLFKVSRIILDRRYILGIENNIEVRGLCFCYCVRRRGVLVVVEIEGDILGSLLQVTFPTPVSPLRFFHFHKLL